MEKIKLSAKFVKELKELPENGMGFQLVNIIMKDETVLTNRVIFNCEQLVQKVGENLDVKNIKEIEIDLTI
jgi:hypothetical protein